ncbi:cell surface-anchored protein SclH [Streptococcus equi subsp. zooepidemicus Sz16]|nr:cell surface-anchored protein SclH [Streptococcus equi subsp. zooepidemicus Sz16]
MPEVPKAPETPEQSPAPQAPKSSEQPASPKAPAPQSAPNKSGAPATQKGTLPATGEANHPFFTLAALSVIASAGVLGLKKKQN